MQYFKLNEPDVSYQLFDNEILTINLKSGNYHSLRDTAAAYFRLLIDGYSIEESLNKIAEIYKVTSISIEAELNSLLIDMIKEKLIVECTHKPLLKPIDWENTIKTTYSTPILETYNDMQDLLLLDPIHDVDVKKGWPNK
jgi:hypothetical protein